MLNFNYCPLVWIFSNATSLLKKIENLQKRALRFLYNNYQLTCEELLDKANSSTMNVERLHFLCVEIYKTINNLNPSFMNQIFELRETNRNVREKYRLNLNIPKVFENIWTENLEVYHTTLNLQKILKLSKLLSETGTVLIAKCVICKKL